MNRLRLNSRNLSTQQKPDHIISGFLLVPPIYDLSQPFHTFFPNKTLTIPPNQNLHDGFDPVDFLVNLDHFQVHRPEIVSSQVSKDFAGQLTSNPQHIDLWEILKKMLRNKQGAYVPWGI